MISTVKTALCRYNGAEGLHTKVTEFVKDKDCLVCGPGVLIELDSTVTLKKVLNLSKLMKLISLVKFLVCDFHSCSPTPPFCMEAVH